MWVRMRRRRESYFNWKFSHNCCFKFSRLCRFSFPITLCIHSFRFIHSVLFSRSLFSRSKSWTEQHLYSSFFHIHSSLILKFFCASPASSSETQECPLTGSYTIMGPLGPPYMTSRHKRNHVNGSHYHHSLGRQHDLLAFHNSNNEHDHISHPHDRLNSQRHRRDLLSKCTSAHKQRRRLSIGCSRYDVFEVNPQCSETGDEGTEISQISFRCYFFIFISSSHSLTPLWNLLEIRVFYGKKSSEKNIYIIYTKNDEEEERRGGWCRLKTHERWKWNGKRGTLRRKCSQFYNFSYLSLHFFLLYRSLIRHIHQWTFFFLQLFHFFHFNPFLFFTSLEWKKKKSFNSHFIVQAKFFHFKLSLCSALLCKWKSLFLIQDFGWNSYWWDQWE